MNKSASATKSSTADREIVTTRLLAAPREVVYRAWTELDQIERWWGPRGFTTTTSSHAVKPGGKWIFVMHGPDGTDFPNRIVFDEVVPNERLSYSHDDGKDPPGHVFHSTVTFVSEGEKTRVTMRGVFPSVAEYERVKGFAVEGGRQTIDKLQEWIASLATRGDDALAITRVLAAPRSLVFKAWTEPERLAKWWGPKGMSISVAQLELKPGGTFHYSMKTPDGQTMWGKFVYREITPPSRLVFVSSFSDEKAGISRHPLAPAFPAEILSTIEFTEQDGRTTLTMRGEPLNASAAEREFFLGARSGMVQGWGGTFGQLDEYLRTASE